MSEAVKELIDIVIKLRSDNGCDWDRKQTSESLTPHLIEEANEVVDAVLEKNSENLKEELGDLLLHVVFQAVIASEKNTFEFEDVVQQINEKLIKRHPHIFDKNYDGEDLSNAKNWELIKKSEKNRESILDGMPKSLSALIVAQRYQDKTGAVGFEWENFSQAMDKVDEELGELKQAINNILLTANTVRITCDKGTDIYGSPPKNGAVEDVSVRRFPLGVPQPLNACQMSGYVALDKYLTPTGSKVYSPASIEIKQTVLAQIQNGIISQEAPISLETVWIKGGAEKWNFLKNQIVELGRAGYPGCIGCAGPAASEPWDESISRDGKN